MANYRNIPPAYYDGLEFQLDKIKEENEELPEHCGPRFESEEDEEAYWEAMGESNLF
jgi:hypothetical protein